MNLRIGRIRLAILLIALSLIFTVGTQVQSHAQVCGATVLASVVLATDLDCPISHGLILSDGVTLDCDGHTIRGAKRPEQYGIYIRDASNVSVSNCIVEHFEVGIRLRGAENVILRSNITRENTRYGMELTRSSTGALIEGNDVSNNGDEGVHVSGPLDRNAGHWIIGNLIDANASEGVYLLESHENVVADNEIRNQGAGGIYVKMSDRNLISHNILTRDPIQLVDGSHLNAVKGNSVVGGSVGISIAGDRNTVAENVVTGTAISAIGARGQENVFSCNWIGQNATGFYFDTGATPNTVNMNWITANTIGLDAADLPPEAPAIDATSNWWGCPDGPASPGCDPAIGNADASVPLRVEPPDADGDGAGDGCDSCTDTDGDGLANPGFPGSTCPIDNCPDHANSSQSDSDSDGMGDVCDACPLDKDNDSDGDGICGDIDICPLDPDDDIDRDTVCGDVDNCPNDSNPDQADSDRDSIGDACDPCTDTDGDGFANPGFPGSTACLPFDNCPDSANPSQSDTDSDGLGDACDSCTDTDDDGFADPGFPASTCRIDNCPVIPNSDQTDDDRNGTGDVCECSAPTPGRCIAGGGNKSTDCLVEFNTTGPIHINKKRNRVKRRLRCSDGDPRCDRDGFVNGYCTFGVTVCLGNDDPRLARRCQPSEIRSIEVRRPSADAARSRIDRDNALRLEQVLSAVGLGIRRHGEIVLAGSKSPPSVNTCSPLVELVVPAPISSREKAIKRKLHVDGFAADGRRDRDRIVLKCAAGPAKP